MDKKFLRDPDGGIHILKKKAELGVLDNEEPSMNETFPKAGFTTDLKGLPRISFGTVWRFMIETVECKKQLSTAKPLVKGFNFFKSGHVLYIGSIFENGKHFIKSQVLPSMKKDKVYTCFLVLSTVGQMLRAHCKCPAGIDGRCNHVASTLFALEQHCKDRGKQSTEEEQSCTSKPCTWSVPRKRKGPVVAIKEMTFEKHDYAKEKKRRNLNKNDAPGPAIWESDKVSRVMTMMLEYQRQSGNVLSWIHILPQEIKDNEILVSPIKVHPVSRSELKEKMHKVKRKLMVDDKERDHIENITRGQSDKQMWHTHRQPRITATKCYRVAVQRDTTSPTKIIKDVLGYNKAFQSKAMKEGILMEDKIINEYIVFKKKNGAQGVSVSKCGFFVSKSHGFLGASPDGLVEDPSSNDPQGLIEVKYVQTNKGEEIEAALVNKGICKCNSGITTFNEKHKYYYQVQQQMYVTERKWTDFVVKGSNCSSLFCQRVHFSLDLWNTILPKLECFFENWIAPELVYPSIKHGNTKLDARSI